MNVPATINYNQSIHRQPMHVNTRKRSEPEQSGFTAWFRGRKTVPLKPYININSISPCPISRSTMTHRSWEKNLWLANCLIIPLIAYPILSLFGHLVIEICKDHKAEAYSKVQAYLDGKRQLTSEENTLKGGSGSPRKIELSNLDVEIVKNILEDNSADIMNDSFYVLLKNAKHYKFQY